MRTILLYLRAQFANSLFHRSFYPHKKYVLHIYLQDVTPYTRMSFFQRIPSVIYANELDTKKWYDVYVSCSLKHWVLSVRERGTSLPFTTFEITKDAGHNLVAIMNNKCASNFIYKGTVLKSMYELCDIADGVRCGMGKYNVFTNNCQDFCNNCLKVLGLPTQMTTFTSTLVAGIGFILIFVFRK